MLRSHDMAPLIDRRLLWNAVLVTTVLQVCDQLVTRYLWSHITRSFISAVPEDFWGIDASGERQPNDQISEYDFYTYELPRSFVEGIVIQILAYYKACWLERLLPTRAAKREDAQLQDKDKEIRGREQMEQEIMQKLIAEGKVKPASINWRNVLVRWLLDDIPGHLAVGLVGYGMYSMTRLHPFSQVVEELPMAVINIMVGYWLSMDPLFSLIGHAYVPVHYRLQFWAAASLTLNLFLSLILRPIVPWFMKLKVVEKWFQEGAAQNRLNDWWAREMKRHDEERAKLDAEMEEMFASWREKETVTDDGEL
jgi:hypothetical protein